MKKIIALVRVSTDKQEIESQKFEMLKYCKELKFKESEILWVEAKGASARKEDKAYKDMLEQLKSELQNTPTIKAVAMWHLNRLGRNEDTLISLKKWFIENKIQVYVKENSLKLFEEDGTVNDSADMMWNIFANLVKQETKEMFAKFKRAKERNTRDGKWNGGGWGVMYGYITDDNNYIIPNKEEAVFVNEIFKHYATGKYSFTTLAAELKELGYTNRGRNITVKWIREIVSNEAYTGKKTKEGRTYPRIIEDDLFNKCSALRGDKHPTPYKGSAYRTINLAQGLLKCGCCGGNYCKQSGDTYACTNRLKVMVVTYGEKCKEGKPISYDLIEKLVWETAQTAHFDFIKSSNKEQAEQLEVNISILKKKLETVTEEIKGIDDKKEKIGDNYVNGIYTAKKRDDMLAKVEAEAAELKQRIEQIKKEISDSERQISLISNPNDVDKIKAFEDLITDEDKKKQKEIVNLHIDKITIDYESNFYDLNKDDGSTTEAKILTFKMKNPKYNRTFVYYYKCKKGNKLWISNGKKIIPYGQDKWKVFVDGKQITGRAFTLEQVYQITNLLKPDLIGEIRKKGSTN